MNYESLGYMAAFFTTSAFLPQIIKCIKTRHTKDLAYGLLLLQSTGCFFWSVYGIITHSLPIILANVITFFCVILLLLYKAKQDFIKSAK
jgi:MtN3 and saliva related transmembrane protein